MSETAVMLVRETTVEHINRLWVSCRNLKTAVMLGQDLNLARTGSPEDVVAIAQKYGLMSMSAASL